MPCQELCITVKHFSSALNCFWSGIPACCVDYEQGDAWHTRCRTFHKLTGTPTGATMAAAQLRLRVTTPTASSGEGRHILPFFIASCSPFITARQSSSLRRGQPWTHQMHACISSEKGLWNRCYPCPTHRPVRVVPDPIRGAPHVLVMCEVFGPDGASLPSASPTRASWDGCVHIRAFLASFPYSLIAQCG